mmetsp:Transcript_6589/g.16793  ORF Transcript_6589/g.16793 Transcript_6589/m.16793 type:complete len:123 (-) Transcript_6589:161-529(-)
MRGQQTCVGVASRRLRAASVVLTHGQLQLSGIAQRSSSVAGSERASERSERIRRGNVGARVLFCKSDEARVGRNVGTELETSRAPWSCFGFEQAYQLRMAADGAKHHTDSVVKEARKIVCWV